MPLLRPFSDWPVQSLVLKGLYGRVEAGEVPHALLFAGPLDVSAKFTKYFAQMLLCTGVGAPCGECEACVQFHAGVHPDYHVVNAEQSGSVKTGQIEALQDHLSLRTHAGGRMVYVIHQIDAATGVAANRLLKTLEEPSKQIIALLTTESPGKVLPTILSRTFSYRMDESSPESAWDDALSIPSAADEESQILEFADSLNAVIKWTETLLKGVEPVLLLADSFMKSSSSIDLSEALRILAAWIRDVMHARSGASQYIRFTEHQTELLAQSKLASIDVFAQAIEIILDARVRLTAHVSPILNVEQMCIRLREVTSGVQRSRSPL